ncbi:N-acetylglucosaminyl-phosphatidylinositol biosynthetic protein gpi1-like isoform X1 [Ipomoea triloba]|uniref:N-acetylglucosaminyl-phosphatidylinositol biosynthetic protein gpi1-like isoform X1 n=1 Tax=Ipomoea triloba TaxID=35885 RepID=UPI00125E7F55|nr:N-acetylglucosaminyl-phosphatidylinositol biosynthetic protein gpi1-like isoform X1 [Ipomoea triloba]
MGAAKKCRIWWPDHLSSTSQLSSHPCHFLFGWFISSSEASLDIVIAFSCSEPTLNSSASCLDLQGILHEINKNMPMFPQDDCKLSLLGCYVADGGDCQLINVGAEAVVNSSGQRIYFSGDSDGQDTSGRMNGKLSYGCHKFDVLALQYSSPAEINWIQLAYDRSVIHGRNIALIPNLLCLKWKGLVITQLDVHVIVYETPLFGSHYYSLGYCPSEQVTAHSKKPMWVEDLYQMKLQTDLNIVIQAINTANATKVLFESYFPAKRSTTSFHVFSMFTNFAWPLFAIFLALLSTILFIILQCFHVVWSYVSRSYIYTMLVNIFCKTCKNIKLCFSQLLYWPVFLQDSGLRCQSCVEYAEMAALRRHSMWSSIVVDLLLGNLLSILLYSRAEAACLFVLNSADGITNHILRTGCVWLMGNPAGFKLNAELAGLLGMVSLNAIQIWSTLWLFLNFFLAYLMKMIAVSGSLFGLTTAAALTIDIISLATMHLSALHWLLSLIYSWQIQAISALWRLFRGRKWNPLRQRLDSYGYTVEQHVVGSLLFTPLLLLLPTVSAFYIFFTILNATISLICIVIELGILVIHATPYTKVAVWLVRKKRFPSGIWFEIVSSQCDVTNSSYTGSAAEINLEPSAHCFKSLAVVSFLRGNYLSLREVVSPHYGCVFSAVSRSSMALSAYGILTGKSISYTLGSGQHMKLPWMVIPCKAYWRLCRDAILARRED